MYIENKPGKRKISKLMFNVSNPHDNLSPLHIKGQTQGLHPYKWNCTIAS